MKKTWVILIFMVIVGCTKISTDDILKDKSAVQIGFLESSDVIEAENATDLYLTQDNKIAEKFEKETLEFAHSVFLYDTPEKLREYLLSNQIDINMKLEDGLNLTTIEINDWASKYYRIWENEMNLAYEKLQNHLSDEARKILEDSQMSWYNMDRQNAYLWHEVFLLSKGDGSGDAAMIHIQSIARVRARTFLLAEYYYWLTGDFSFEYDNVK
jgi:uncharacterized protein YecT (DUF1311 family)